MSMKIFENKLIVALRAVARTGRDPKVRNRWRGKQVLVYPYDEYYISKHKAEATYL